MFSLARNEFKCFKMVNVLAIIRKYIIKYFLLKSFPEKNRHRWFYKNNTQELNQY